MASEEPRNVTPPPLPFNPINIILDTMPRNSDLFERACRSIPGGVNSPVRAFRSVGGTPRFIRRARGPYVWDAEGTRYTDYVGSWGPAILGHAHPEVVRAVQEAAVDGLSFGAPTQAEVELAEVLIARLLSLEQVRLVSSGTEATMTAIRLARGTTGRSKIVKFEGCYHGHSDSLLVKAGSGLMTFGNPSSAGVPAEFVAHTLTLEFNNLAAVDAAFQQHGADIACIIVEPIAGNMNLIKPAEGFLEGLREVCTRHGALLIFDEVMTGFRVGPQGVQGLTGVQPDITTLAKVIGGGMPVGAFGGSAEIMKHIAPLGGVYQAGTLSGNPIAVAAGLATLRLISEPGFYESLAAQTAKLAQGLQERGRAAGLAVSADSVGGMFGLYFSQNVPTSFAEVSACDIEAFKRFFHAMLARGVHFAPSAFEVGFVSATHDDEVIQETLNTAEEVFAEMKG
jgi:glutamate-1-semialdehyde 2,1-aminomutase